jgi:hypothetical protein
MHAPQQQHAKIRLAALSVFATKDFKALPGTQCIDVDQCIKSVLSTQSACIVAQTT